MCIEKENKDFKNPIEYKLEKKRWKCTCWGYKNTTWRDKNTSIYASWYAGNCKGDD